MFEMSINLHWIEWFSVSIANQSRLDGVIDSLKFQPIYIGWNGWQFQLPTNLYWMEWFTVLHANKSTLDGVVDSFKCEPIDIGWSGSQF